ncbi:MAG TPA: GspH/FimT family pseudopilin [Thermoanaerobaculia bacterium]
MKRRSPVPGQAGFTMIETLILMSFILLLATFIFPAIQKSMRRVRIESCNQQVATLMHQARFEAIKRGRPAFVEVVGVRAVLARAVSNDDLSRDKVLAEVTCPRDVSIDSPPGTKVAFDPNGANRSGVGLAEEIRVADTQGNRMRARVSMRATGRIELEKLQAGGWYANGDVPDYDGPGGKLGAWRFQ